MTVSPAKRRSNTYMKRSVRRPVKPACSDVLGTLSTEFGIPQPRIEETLRGCGLNLDQDPNGYQMPLYREILSCKSGKFELYASGDPTVGELLDEQLRVFDEIYVDTAPIIQEDWFLKFLADAVPSLRRRKKRLIILEKTMEELHGLKDNPEKDRDVRIRALIRPELIRFLARKGLVRIQDTGSRGIADDHLVSVFAAKRQRESLLLITQDRGLSERIVRIAAEPVEPVTTEEKVGFFARLFGKKPEPIVVDRKMMVCKFNEHGSLCRFYLCPDCEESFYDIPVEGNGLVLCRRCYQNRQLAEQTAAKKAEAEARRAEATARRQELKAAEAARKELERQEAEAAERAAARIAARAAAKEVHTVEDAVRRNRLRILRWVVCIGASVVAVCLCVLIFLLLM